MMTINADERPGEAATMGTPQPFVGREHELAQLSALWRDARRGRPWLILVSGERGLGKTRLAGELAKRVAHDGTRVVYGRCQPGRRLAPDWFWSRSWADDGCEPASPSSPLSLVREPALLAAHRPPRNVEIGEGRLKRRDVIGRIKAELRHASVVHPLLLVLDDLHNADVPTLAALSRLVKELRGAPLLLLGLYRSAETHLSPYLGASLAKLEAEASHLVLPPLSEEETATLAVALATRHLESQVVAEICRTTSGNPLLTHAIVGLLDREADRQSLAPPTVTIQPTARSLTNSTEQPTTPTVNRPNASLVLTAQLGGLKVQWRSFVVGASIGC